MSNAATNAVVALVAMYTEELGSLLDRHRQELARLQQQLTEKERLLGVTAQLAEHVMALDVVLEAAHRFIIVSGKDDRVRNGYWLELDKAVHVARQKLGRVEPAGDAARQGPARDVPPGLA